MKIGYGGFSVEFSLSDFPWVLHRAGRRRSRAIACPRLVMMTANDNTGEVGVLCSVDFFALSKRVEVSPSELALRVGGDGSPGDIVCHLKCRRPEERLAIRQWQTVTYWGDIRVSDPSRLLRAIGAAMGPTLPSAGRVFASVVASRMAGRPLGRT